jgi:hypothetical protein
MSKLPFRFEANASRLPSGDHVGHSESSGSCVNRVTCATMGVSCTRSRLSIHLPSAPSSSNAITAAAGRHGDLPRATPVIIGANSSSESTACCRSSSWFRRSFALCVRWSGFFAKHRRTISARSLGNAGLISVIGRGVSRRMLVIVEILVSPWNGRPPVAISYSITPSEKTSDRGSGCFPSACSGDIYATVPSRTWSCWPSASRRCRTR